MTGHSEIERQSVITCPVCDHASEQIMPVDCCLYYFECPGCGDLLKARPGDCCVFCSYGTVPCPSVQAGAPGCG